MSITKQTVLQRAYKLEIKLQGSGLILAGPQGEFHGDAHTLAILDVFATPKTLDEGLKTLASHARGGLDWIALSGQVLRLCEVGLLATPTAQEITLPSHEGRFSAADVHVRMLNDRARTTAFQKALFEQVGPDDVVVDIGTGTGILAATAALAGARKVYAVERTSNMPRLAREFFERNGLAERVTVIEGDSTRLELPEKADILVSEVIGNDPLGEGIIPTTVDARKRLLKPGARLIPSRLRVCALPLTMPDQRRSRFLFTPAAAHEWKQRYGLDFSSYAEFCAGQSFHTQINTLHTRDWPRLSEPLLLAEVDLHTQEIGPIETHHELRFTRDGLLNAIQVFFEADLGAGIWLSIHPERVKAGNSWASHLWVPGTPVEVRSDSRMALTYRFRNEKSGSQFTLHR